MKQVRQSPGWKSSAHLNERHPVSGWRKNTVNSSPNPPPPSFFYFYLCEQSICTPPAPHPSLSHPHCQGGTTGRLKAVINSLSSGGKMETSCQILYRLSRKLSLPVCCFFFCLLLFCHIFLFFTYFYYSPATPHTEPQRNHEAVKSRHCHASTSLNSSLMKHGDGLYCCQGVIYRFPLPHNPTATHPLHTPPLTSTHHFSLQFRSNQLLSALSSAPVQDGLAILLDIILLVHGSRTTVFLVEVKTCLRCRTVRRKPKGNTTNKCQ